MEKTILQRFLSLFSRTTYTITPESFKEQFDGVNLESFREVKVRNPMNEYSPLVYKANQLKKIVVVDENTHRIILDNSPKLETRFTLKDGKRTTFYFDTIALENGFLIGQKSRMIPIAGKVEFDRIQKIEIQNGGKQYKYY
ncbi:hypothetical protein C8C85_1630 [Flavobacterium sp. 103]|uniref:hypothetical protein n=1 Tax=Flavobacterium sp. 103 TaxID=2135624 RepID=UPI000D5E3F2A|nr:hypothetical protein [Flavobacterium sp. 103]PVX45824.1 hypothetical protein C8C85_1630 [Flavobacterium sp. 103]